MKNDFCITFFDVDNNGIHVPITKIDYTLNTESNTFFVYACGRLFSVDREMYLHVSSTLSKYLQDQFEK